MQQQELTQGEIEWLRCLTVSQKLTPVLPEPVLRKLADANLVESRADKAVLTASGAELLRKR